MNWLSLAIALIKAGGMLANYLAERRLLDYKKVAQGHVKHHVN